MASRPIPLHDRERDYAEARERAEQVGESWLTARTLGRVPRAVEDEMEDALDGLRRAKRRLERAQRRGAA